MITFWPKYYNRLPHAEALRVLNNIGVQPDHLNLSSDGLFTAYFCRERAGRLTDLALDEALEHGGHRIAVFKLPQPELDTGRYLTLRFAFVDLRRVGIDEHTLRAIREAAVAKREDKPVKRLQTLANDMDQLTTYARELAHGYHTHRHLAATLEEIQQQVELLHAELTRLETHGRETQPPLDATLEIGRRAAVAMARAGL